MRNTILSLIVIVMSLHLDAHADSGKPGSWRCVCVPDANSDPADPEACNLRGFIELKTLEIRNEGILVNDKYLGKETWYSGKAECRCDGRRSFSVDSTAVPSTRKDDGEVNVFSMEIQIPKEFFLSETVSGQVVVIEGSGGGAFPFRFRCSRL
jgi:hypothetical protein